MSLLGVDPANPDEFKSHQDTLPGLSLAEVQQLEEMSWEQPKAKKPKAKKPKKRKRLEKSLRDHGYEVSKPQAVMRQEMARGTHKPELVSGVLDAVFGAPVKYDDKVQQLALEIIQGFDMVTNIGNWQVIQQMVEAGIRQGYAKGVEDWATSRG